jgi:hypothetical protein
MFPNVRLMIAATLASVVALICGFGMFAVFRVSHDPFVRLPAATGSLQLVADNAATSSAGFVSGEPFDRRFHVKVPPNAAEEVNAPAAAPEPHVEADTAPAAATQPGRAAPEEASSAAGELMEEPSASATPPTSEAPAVATIDPPASDQPNIAAASQLDAAPTTTNTGTAKAGPSPDTTTAEQDQDLKAPVVATPSAEPEPSTATEVAANEPLNDPPLPRARASFAGEPAGAANLADGRTRKTAMKKPRRIRVAVRVRRVVRVATAQYLQTQYSPTTEQNFGATQSNFQAAPPAQTQFLYRRAIRVRYSRIASRKPRGPNAATGGPFVSATTR